MTIKHEVEQKRKAPNQCLLLYLAMLVAATGLEATPTLARTNVSKLETPVRFDILNQSVGSALIEFSEQAHIQVAMAQEIDLQMKVQALHVMATPLVALDALLQNTGLKHVESGEAISIVRAAYRSLAVVQPSESGASNAETAETGISQPESGIDKHSVEGNEGALASVIVTAQKREERLEDVPVPVAVLSAQSLVDSNLVRIQDYYTKVPGLGLMPDDYGGAQLTIRGLTTGGTTSPTVGIVVDDIPYGSSTGLAANSQAPEIDPSELAQIEVLRGPQGALYGASSIGGLLKYVTSAPDLGAASGRMEGGLSGVHNGDAIGYSARGAVNLPLNESIAIRASGFDRRDPGYISNPLIGVDGINEQIAYGGRLSALWKPSEVLSLRVSALFQRTDRHGSSDVDLLPGLEDLQQNQLRNSGWYVNTLQAYNATFKANVGNAEIVSLTGFSNSSLHRSLDYSAYFAPLAEQFFDVGGSEILINAKTKKVTEEVRLSMPIASKIDWTLGIFYNHEDSPSYEDVPALDVGTGIIEGSIVREEFPSTMSEYAAFTDFTVHIGDRIDVQVGGRESRNTQTYSSLDVGPLVGGVFAGDKLSSKDTSFTYLFTPSLKLTADSLIYARFASGYRPGGPNFNTSTPGVPLSYGHDTTKNYELGAKANFFDHVLAFDGSLYYIDWNDIQLKLFNPNVGNYFTNAGRAKSKGAEVSIDWKPSSTFTMRSWVAWTDATLSDPFPSGSAAIGSAGDRLPFNSRFSGNLSLEQRVNISNSVVGWIGGVASYVGSREGIFATKSFPTRQPFPGYTRIDLRVGASYRSTSLNIFANNVADKRGVLNGGLGTVIPYAFQYIQPRTIGINISQNF